MERATVPTGWNTFELGELYELDNGINADKSAYGTGTPFINVLDVIENEALTGAGIPGRITLPSSVVARYQVRYGDVLFNRTSETQDEVGLASVFLGDAPVVFGGFVFRARPKTDTLDTCYAKYALRAHPVREQIIARGQGGIRANIGQRDLKSVRVSLPPGNEQRKIVETLTAVDELIESLRRMIAKKEAIKQGMMQQLFAHRSDNVGVVPLGAVTSWLSGGTPDRANADFWSGTIPWISATTLKNTEVSDSAQRVSPTAVRRGSRMAPLGSTLLLVRGSALHSEIRASLVTAPVCFNQDVKALVPSSSFIPKFLTYSIHGNADRLLRLVSSAGNTAGVLDTTVLKSFEIWLPSCIEQERVVSVLDDVTREIDQLQRRLTKAEAIKLGMMQELLTGRTRLPVEEGVP